MSADGKIFVTGATGFIGTRLVQALTGRGFAIRALSRREHPEPPPGFGFADRGPLEHEQVELVRGDVTDPDSIARGVEGCTHVYHMAGHAKNWARDPRVFYEVNVRGTLNVLRAAKQAGVQRVVWTSSQLTLGPARPGEVTTEDTPRISDRCFTDYEASKLEAERQVLRGVQEEGFPVVIVLPTRVYGPGNLTEGNSAAMLIDQYDRGLMPILPNLGRNVGNWVLVDDVVEGHLLAMEKGRIGQRYLLGGENASLAQFFRTIDRISGKRHWQVPVFRLLPMVIAHVMKTLGERFGIHPKVTPGWVRTFFTEWPCSCEKAQRELGYKPTSLDEGIRITYEWLQRVRKERS